MFNLGFTMEELMFPENYQTKFFKHESDEIFSLNEEQEQIMIDDGDDDWFTIQQLNPDLSSIDNHININRMSNCVSSFSNVYFDQYSVNKNKSIIEFDSTLSALLLPNLSIKITNEKNYNSSSSSLSSEIGSSDNISLSSNQHLLKSTHSIKHMMSKSTSSLSFCTQSSTSMTNSSADEISLHSNDFNDQSTESVHELSYYHKHNKHFNENLSNSRRRRKRTIFSGNDIEHLKEAFIQNPKPTQQDIALLSEQLGYDSYVIRVWFYNKRQATKKGD